MELDLTLWAISLEDLPCLVSMGKLCRECGYTCTQEGALTQVLTKGQLKVPCQTVYDMPYIIPFGPPEAGGNPEAKPKEDPAFKPEVPEKGKAEGNLEALEEKEDEDELPALQASSES